MVSDTENCRPGGAPIRVLTFTTLYPSAAQPSHGIFVENRLRHLLATGRVQARVVAPVPWFPSTASVFGRYALLARAPRSENRNGIPIAHPRHIILPRLSMPFAPISLFAATLSLIRQHKRLADFDLIDAHYFYPDGVAAVLLGQAVGKPVVITARGTDINLIPRYVIPRRLIRYAAQRAAGMIAVSQALKDAMVALGIAPERIAVLRNGVDLVMFRPGDREVSRAALGINGRILLSVGHLIERKGHDLTIGALSRLQGYTLLLAGDGPEHARLRALASTLGVADRVRFLGAVPHQELANLYTAADALVLSSSREGWPNVLLEAMACGTPVVASAIWGNPEIVSRPEAGVLMRARTPECIAEAVQTLLRASPRRQATRAFAERFSWDDTSAGQIQLFERILARSRDSGSIVSR
ncbi:MAG TPA: glycosyltransferase family 4 protein [Rhizomicrobium sp.]|jgi:glycosyltransferase involved in cell wall biosynthesis|nr:glycosyltransferase family 4 protein [Rhizomicrobium sp.]